MLQFKLHKKLTIILSSLKYRYRGNAVVNSCEFIFLDLFTGLHNILLVYIIYGLPDGSDRKNLLAIQETWFNTWVGKIPWRREWQPTPIFLPGECYGQRSLAGYSPWGHRVGHNWTTNTLHNVLSIIYVQFFRILMNRSFYHYETGLVISGNTLWFQVYIFSFSYSHLSFLYLAFSSYNLPILYILY